MKNIKIITLSLFLFGIVGCEESIDLENLNQLNVENFYVNTAQLQNGLNGCYAGMRAPLTEEWSLTEVRSDNAFMSNRSTTNVNNLNLRDLDIFNPSTNLNRIYNYWYSSYQNIRNVNFLLGSLNVNYNPNSGTISYDEFNLPVSELDRKQMSAQASFIRAYHYFNLVRLYGDVFIVHDVLPPGASVTIDRSPVSEVYKLIEADLINSIDNGISSTYSALPNADRGRVTTWAAKALLAKVYLTQNRKTEAAILLNDVIANSGYSLLTGTDSYANVFSSTNEMNAEILFAIRFKSGGLGQGSSLANLFAPIGFVINGNGLGYNGVTVEYANSFQPGDTRKDINATLQSGSNPNFRYYSSKHLTQVTLANDSELDWPVLRFSDVLLMLAEAEGNTPNSLNAINMVHQRAGLPAILPSAVATTSEFETVLANERRWEFGAENQRWFDLLRFGTTLNTINVINAMEMHFDNMASVYNGSGGNAYNSNVGMPNISVIKNNLNNRALLPIPQQEIDTNTTISIMQNPGY